MQEHVPITFSCAQLLIDLVHLLGEQAEEAGPLLLLEIAVVVMLHENLDELL